MIPKSISDHFCKYLRSYLWATPHQKPPASVRPHTETRCLGPWGSIQNRLSVPGTSVALGLPLCPDLVCGLPRGRVAFKSLFLLSLMLPRSPSRKQSLLGLKIWRQHCRTPPPAPPKGGLQCAAGEQVGFSWESLLFWPPRHTRTSSLVGIRFSCLGAISIQSSASQCNLCCTRLFLNNRQVLTSLFSPSTL